jgi:DNA-binding NarL/FixJ family response regulator
VLASLAKLRLADLRRRQGRLGESGSLLRELEAASDRVGAGHLVDAVRAAVALEGGKSAEAVHLAVRYMRTVPDDDLTERIDGLEVLVRAHLVADASGPAADAAAELAHIAAVVPTGLIRASASFAHGIVAASKGELTTARDALEEAHGLYLSSGTPFELAETSGELARVLSGLGSADLAIEHARSALRGFERLGAGRRREAAGRLLAQLVDAHGRRRKDVPLTPREIEVLRLVARGHSNDEIAAALYLSVRTVERHLSNIYAKIGAYGRAARAAAASYAHLHQLT